MQLNIKYPKLF